MEEHAHTHHQSHGWLDQLAISMAAICAVHCLLTPILIIALPIIATTFFVHEDFHIWMLAGVIPTTSFAVFMGCRKHKDKWVVTLSAFGLSLLVGALAFERLSHGEVPHGDHVHSIGSVLPWINTFGGLFLASAHVRNYRLCRKTDCQHD
ncbi:MerC domain-containing protein [Coraliomargarita parva]|uniref:MerC domain-containing protein n=1 Tax=Coraliomargarita parva TaxID=3014050 RepID=UPI0022B3BF71|nr:MerC domain-containing protein [Coraliomargarita parva]